MPRHYEIVGEPEALEVVDDDVYNPDQSFNVNLPQSSAQFSRGGGGSQRSSIMQPILSEPIGLKTIFFDPRWSATTVIVVSGFLLCVLIALFVGLIRVLGALADVEQMQKYGLQVTPILDHSDDDKTIIFEYNFNGKEKSENNIRNTKAIQEVIDYYKNMTVNDTTWVDCQGKYDPAKKCKFDFKALEQGNCSRKSNYQWPNKSSHATDDLSKVSSPCILIEFRKPPNWDVPATKQNDVKLSVSCYSTKDNGRINNLQDQKTNEDFFFWPSDQLSMDYLNSPSAALVPPMMFIHMKKGYSAHARLVCNLYNNKQTGKTILDFDGIDFRGMLQQTFIYQRI